MVRLVSLSLLAALASTALARFIGHQEVLDDASNLLSNHWSYVNCGSPSDIVHIKSIALSPDPPEPGKDLTVTVIGIADQTIEEGAYADVVVKLGLIKLLTKEFDVCEEARNAKTSIQCPVEPGKYTVSHTVHLPWEIPKAKFNVNVQGYSVDDEDLFCLDLKADFMNLPWF